MLARRAGVLEDRAEHFPALAVELHHLQLLVDAVIVRRGVADDAGMKKYFEFMAKYYPDGDKDSSFNSYGYMTSQLMIHVLEKCGDNLTRENVMKVATSLKGVQLDLALPGIVNTTTPDDYRVNKQLQMMKFNGERWELFGPILEDAGPAG